MTDNTLTPITEQSALEDLCGRLAEADFVCVDTEFHRETTYWPELCLIQASGPGVEGVIDPRAEDLDIKPFLDLIASDRQTKVFHAARQDIEIFNRLIGHPPGPIFDTQIAAMALGFGDSISYDNLVQRVLKKQIDKSSQFTDWMRRPLSQKQLVYALGDVTHLRDIYLKMRDELERTDRLTWVREEMSDLENPETYDTDPLNAWQRLKLRMPKKDYAAIVVSVAAWRERVAQELDKPRRRILKDDAIQEIAQQKPRTADALERMRAVPNGFAKSRHGQGLIHAINQALDDPDKYAPDVERPESAGPPPGAVGELLKVLLKQVSDDAGVATRLIANAADLEKLAREDNPDIAALKGWRREVFGEMALRLKSGKVALAASPKGVKIVEV
jgi:ribonuclease D